ncbi:Polyphosphoinositide phosphatase [Gossypium arboreum]|uniref:Polyphosphoinositide phosphatase n=1 Tax=Gossypium arboreum TaxID=29729 RepID=A0A0B0PDV9_GOSAR|nr:Polyphosphoinositide phosphatase [Gossypium arboreum]KHG24623.1 Polyphosphoinositide phosphatase [Gossypium arboreum]
MAGESGSDAGPDSSPCYLQKFRLYETRSNFYMIGRDKNRTLWRVLKIDRLDPSELTVIEDSTAYSEIECFDLLRRIHEGNRSSGGLKFVTACYGIVGFIKFLGSYSMMLITKRMKIGAICGHTVYAISKSEMIPISKSPNQSNMAYSKNEKRYKKLLSTVDLTKDFFFSYTYNVMHSLQRNLCRNETGEVPYETMFVWNEFLTRGIRNTLKNTLWTVALVYGFFKQVKLSVSGRDFCLTLISRRSRHYAGTRYLKRGVNEKGRVANDVETEQIVFEDVHEGCPTQISSVVQNRGSIPLFWSQETSRLNLKPDIILSKKDPNYEATRLHFEDLVRRYGNPIIILNLIKRCEKKPRESILRAEFANAIRFINKSLSKENRLRFLHWDLNRHSRKATNVLTLLGRVADYALNLTGIFYCQVTSNRRQDGLLTLSCLVKSDECPAKIPSEKSDDFEKWETDVANDNESISENVKPPMFQTGVLRTNCIDCLDRTNVAQYAYGLVALGHQLHAMGFTESQTIDQNSPLAEDLMGVYEAMGDTLALQYGGSAAHNKIFCQRRGQWKAATQSQEFFRTLQRYYSNAYMDAEKQSAINLFLGHFQPQQGKPALWELDSDQHYSIGRNGPNRYNENARPSFKRSLSDGNIVCDMDSPLAPSNIGHRQPLCENRGTFNGLSESTPEIPTSEISYSRQLFGDMEDQFLESDGICYDEIGDECNCTNFDLDWPSSSGNSCDDDIFDRSTTGLSSENIGAELKIDMTTSPSESGSSIKGGDRTASELTCGGILDEFSESFVNWVTHGDMLIPSKFISKVVP